MLAPRLGTHSEKLAFRSGAVANLGESICGLEEDYTQTRKRCAICTFFYYFFIHFFSRKNLTKI